METRDPDADRPAPPVENVPQQGEPSKPKERRPLPTAAPSSSRAERGKVSGRDSLAGRAACTECQRRKQKCNRWWPCNQCQKRKVPSECRFFDKAPTKRLYEGLDDEAAKNSKNEENNKPVPPPEGGFEALGYASSGLFFADLKLDSSVKVTRIPQKQTFADSKSCPPLERALEMLPTRRYTDSIVRNFLQNVNFHYYMIHPKSFVREYHVWWEDRTEGRPLGLEWTSVLLMICACSTLFPSVKLQKRLERNLGDSCEALSERFHTTGRALHSAVPINHNHIFKVLKLVHSCYWFKSKARFGEAWHVLDAAIREAQELRLHKEGARRDVPELQRELNRRLWCVLNTWDWQMSALLSRPLIIDHAGTDVGLPSLTLEAFSPSPLLHMRTQSDLITQLAIKFGQPKNITKPAVVTEYQDTVQDWMRRLPAPYSMTDPDTSKDEAHPWIKLHRHYLHAAGYCMILEPTRKFIAENISRSSGEDILQIRRNGVNYSLSLMECLCGFFEHVWPREVKFYYLLFTIFDTAAFQASIILRDEDKSAERRDDMADSIDGALSMVKQLATFTKPAQTYCGILGSLRRRVFRKLGLHRTEGPSRKRARVTAITSNRLPVFANPMVDAGDSDNDSDSSTQSLLPKLFDVSTSSQSHSISQPSEHTQPTSGPQLEPPSSVIYPDGTLNMTPFMEDQWTPQGTPAFQAPTPQNDHYGAGQGSAEGQEYDLDTAPPMEALSEALPDMGFSNMTTEELGALTELWRWDSLDPGPSNSNIYSHRSGR